MSWSYEILDTRALAFLRRGRPESDIPAKEVRALAREYRALIDELSGEVLEVARGWHESRRAQPFLIPEPDVDGAARLNEVCGALECARVKFGLSASTPEKKA